MRLLQVNTQGRIVVPSDLTKAYKTLYKVSVNENGTIILEPTDLKEKPIQPCTSYYQQYMRDYQRKHKKEMRAYHKKYYQENKKLKKDYENGK